MSITSLDADYAVNRNDLGNNEVSAILEQIAKGRATSGTIPTMCSIMKRFELDSIRGVIRANFCL